MGGARCSRALKGMRARNFRQTDSIVSPLDKLIPSTMRHLTIGAAILMTVAASAGAQPGKFPPDSLVNVHVIPRNTPVREVVGTMRDFTAALGVRCQFCHVGQEGLPLEQFDFISDEKRTKGISRQMMLMVQQINRRLDSLPNRGSPPIQVTCMTCHRGVSRPTIVRDSTPPRPPNRH
jgi:hypothetical protein